MSSKPGASRLVVNEKGLIRLWCRYQRMANSFAAAVPAATTGLKLPWFASGAKQDTQRKKAEGWKKFERKKARMQIQRNGKGEKRRESVSMCRGEGGRCSIDGWQLRWREKRPGTALNLNGTARGCLCISSQPVPKIILGPQLQFLYYNFAVGGFTAFFHSIGTRSKTNEH